MAQRHRPGKNAEAIVAKLSKELVRISAARRQRAFQQPGSRCCRLDPEEVSALIRKEIAMYAKLVKQIGFQPQ